MSHTYSCLLTHLVFSTKNRQPLIADVFRERLFEYMAGIARGEAGLTLRAGGTEDHVHVLTAMRPDVTISGTVNRLKSASSLWVHRTFPGHGAFGWQQGYAAFSVCPSNMTRVVQYIKRQDAHHRKVTFWEEFITLVRLHRRGMLDESWRTHGPRPYGRG